MIKLMENRFWEPWEWAAGGLYLVVVVLRVSLRCDL